MHLKTWQKSKNYTLTKLLQGFRQQVTWQTLLESGNNLVNFYLKIHMSIEVKILQPFYSDPYSLCETAENLLLDKKKKIHTKSLAG